LVAVLVTLDPTFSKPVLTWGMYFLEVVLTTLNPFLNPFFEVVVTALKPF
jgi:hypothetical protein